MTSHSNSTVSVVVPTFNRLEQLQRTLVGLSAQVGLESELEVVIVDDGSDDGTAEWLDSGDTPLDVIAVSQENQGPAAARNRGIRAATGDLVLFLDDDVVPAPDLVDAHLRRHRSDDHDLVVIGPMRTPDVAMSPWVKWEQRQLEKQYNAMLDGDWEATARQFYTGNASVHRRHLIQAGGFDTSFRRAEDVELGYRLADAGLRFVFEPNAEVHHYAERSFRSWRDAAAQYGRSDAVFGREHGHDWLFELVLKEFHYRHVLVRATTRLTLRSRAARAVLLPASDATARLLCRTNNSRLTDAALSALYNLRYYHGMAVEVGGGRELLALLNASAPD